MHSPTYRFKYGNAEKILHQFCLDLVFLFCKKLDELCIEGGGGGEGGDK